MLDLFFPELAKRNATLYWFGWTNIALFVLAVIMYFSDQTLILGINAWIKPMKFALSITIYSWTVGWLLGYSSHPKANRIVTIGLVITMTAEIVLIFMQSFRGTTSHFNIQSAFDGIVFGVMGLFIGLNTLINVYAAMVFLVGKVTISGPKLWAWRAGLILFTLGGISGGWMVGHLAHTVGAPDGGPGLPFLNWSTVAGDIRAAHFVTLHGLQILPLSAMGLSQLPSQVTSRWVALTIFLYTALCLFLHIQAWMGIPMIGI